MEKICVTCRKKYKAKSEHQRYCNTFTCGPTALKQRHRWRILERDGFRCIYCGATPWDDNAKLHLDHIVPLVDDGKSTASNIVTSCKSCNISKNKRPIRKETREVILKEVGRRNVNSNIPGEMPAGDGQYLKAKV